MGGVQLIGMQMLAQDVGMQNEVGVEEDNEEANDGEMNMENVNQVMVIRQSAVNPGMAPEAKHVDEMEP